MGSQIELRFPQRKEPARKDSSFFIFAVIFERHHTVINNETDRTP